ncbi:MULTISPECIES: hypothetical protein [Arthrobacter]|uniref:hypothetical protein n=1 Tax=Arthrobacter TaxID=1663 RepID=UPI0021028137|nr:MULTISPECIES: hypothetical protein [Arthrobacter]MCQ1954795.1 hypothetical protein [Arthrobacter sp. zg-Y238]MCQ1957997.1 hypothetical protein [Arthrobacter jinronghuae]
MKKSIKAGALLVAGVFVLSGCGSSEGSSDSGSAETKSASAKPTPTTQAVGEKQYTADELEEALAAVMKDKNLDGPLGNDETVRPEMMNAVDPLEGITIAPASCDVLASTNINKVLDNAYIAVLLLNETDSLTVVSHSDPAVLEKQVEDNDSLLGECAQYTMEGPGGQATVINKGIEASTDADTTQAFHSITSNGTVEEGITQVAGASGTTNIAARFVNSADPEASVAEAEELIDAVYAELEKQ